MKFKSEFLNEIKERGFIYQNTDIENLDNIITKIEIKINVNNENFCCVLFFKNADLIAIIKSSLLDAISFNIQST